MLIRVWHAFGPPAAGRLADAEIQFERGVLAGFTLSGFTINRQNVGGPLSVGLPSRSGRLFLHPASRVEMERIWELMLEAYQTSLVLGTADVPIEDIFGRRGGEDDVGDLEDALLTEEVPTP